MNKKILVIDDESSIRTTLKMLLESENYDVDVVPNADIAWKKLESGKSKPHVVLLDIMMPGMKPVDFIKKVKADSKLKSIKIIHLTAVLGAKKMKISGVFNTIEKPFQNNVILSVIKKALG